MNKLRIYWLNFLMKINAQSALKNFVHKKVRNAWYKKEWQQDLFKTKHPEVLINIVAEKHDLSETILMGILSLPNAKDMLLDCVKKQQLPIPVEMKLFDRADMKEVIRTYVSRQHISDKAIIKLFDLPDEEELIITYIYEKGFPFPQEAQIKLFDMKDWKTALKYYSVRYYLSPDTLEKMIAHPNAREMLNIYLDYWAIPKALHLQILQLPYAKELFKKRKFSGLSNEVLMHLIKDMPEAGDLLCHYIKQNFHIGTNEERELFSREDASDVISAYVATSRKLAPENESLLLNMPDGTSLMKQYLTNRSVSDNTVEEIFKHPDANELLPVLLSHQKISDAAQKRLFSHPDVATLLPLYIEHDPLCEEAQFMLFKLPDCTAAHLLQLYSKKQKFAEHVMQYLAIANYF